MTQLAAGQVAAESSAGLRPELYATTEAFTDLASAYEASSETSLSADTI